MSHPYRGKAPRGKYTWRGRRGNCRGRDNSSEKPYSSKQGPSYSKSTNDQNRGGHVNRFPASNCPFKKWQTYLQDDSFNQNSEFSAKVTKLYNYFKANLNQFDKEVVEEQEEVYLDYQALVTDPDLIEEIPSLASDVKNEPSRFLPAISLALHEAFLNGQFEESNSSISVFFDIPYINIRLLNYEPVIALKSLKASYFGKLVAIRGTVVRVGNIKPILKKMAFSCNRCGEEQVINIPDGKYKVPTSCDGFNCRGHSFTPLRCSPKTETVNWQVIKIQEMILDDQREAGRIPRNIECELTYGLVDNCIPGDMVTITGVVKASSSDENQGRSKDKCMYLLYIHAVSVSNSKEINDGKENESSEFSIKDLYGIQEIQSEANLFRLITGSLCPTIYGHELVKAGMALALFGGSKKSIDEKNEIPIRSDPHVLVVGDPGLGKSQLLQAVANIAPRGVYVCGNTTTTSGLTVTLTKESGSGDYALEAGALVLADRGCCCIDEFDKMSNQHNALLEAMEQQSISLAKAGIVCSLPARTSIIAAANPVGGHYNKAKTVSENLRMNSALLSRFDLVFILLDKPDEEIDSLLSEHVMSLHSDTARHRTTAVTSVTVERNPTTKRVQEKVGNIWESENALLGRLKVDKREHLDPIPSQLLRKYVQYARKYVHPKLSSEAAKVLKEFYLNLRKQRQGVDSTPITTRQLEAMLRLTEARARLELREKATEQDAKDVVDIMKNSLIDTFTNEYGGLDFDRSINGSGMSKRNKCKKFIAELNRISDRENNPMFTVEEMYRISNQLQLGINNFDDFIVNLNNQNFLLKKGSRLYQLQTASCL